jgi:hypothetical protein
MENDIRTRIVYTLTMGVRLIPHGLISCQPWKSHEDLISFVINRLNPTYNSFITAFYFAVWDRELSFADFQAGLLSHEILLEIESAASDDISFYQQSTLSWLSQQ